MRVVIILQLSLWLFIFSCKTEHKKIAKEKAIDSLGILQIEVKDSINEGIDNEEEQSTLDYTLNYKEVKTLQDSARYLKHYFNQFEKTNDSLSEVLFFKMFPDNFENFKKLYGYDDTHNENEFKGSPLYSSYNHIHNYVPLNISEKDYLKKIISIGVNGHWQSDNVGVVQHSLQKFYRSDSQLFFSLLNKKNKLEIASFWVFFFDGPHPENKQELYNKVLNNLKEVDESMIPIVKKSYAQVKEDWGEH